MYLDRKFGLSLSLSEITLLFDLSLYLDRTLAQRKAKSKVKVAHCANACLSATADLPAHNLHKHHGWHTNDSLNWQSIPFQKDLSSHNFIINTNIVKKTGLKIC